MTNDELYTAAQMAINKLYNDTSVSQATCRENLQALKDDIDILLDTLDEEE